MADDEVNSGVERCPICRREAYLCKDKNCPVALVSAVGMLSPSSPLIAMFKVVMQAASKAGIEGPKISIEVNNVMGKKYTVGGDAVGTSIGDGNANTIRDVKVTHAALDNDEHVSREQWEEDVAEVLRALVSKTGELDERMAAIGFLERTKDVVAAEGAPVALIEATLAKHTKKEALSAGARAVLKGVLDTVTETVTKTLIERAIG